MRIMICFGLGMLIFAIILWLMGVYEEPEGDKACRNCPEWSNCRGKNSDCWWRW